MSDRLREAYRKKEEKRIEAVVKHINRKHLARMHKAGEGFYARRKREEDEGLPKFSLKR